MDPCATRRSPPHLAAGQGGRRGTRREEGCRGPSVAAIQSGPVSTRSRYEQAVRPRLRRVRPHAAARRACGDLPQRRRAPVGVRAVHVPGAAGGVESAMRCPWDEPGGGGARAAAIAAELAARQARGASCRGSRGRSGGVPGPVLVRGPGHSGPGSFCESRQVHAVPASTERMDLRRSSCLTRSEPSRTVTGVARSLGLPAASVLPSDSRPSIVDIVVSVGAVLVPLRGRPVRRSAEAVRVAAQGYELDELSADERAPNAAAELNMDGSSWPADAARWQVRHRSQEHAQPC